MADSASHKHPDIVVSRWSDGNFTFETVPLIASIKGTPNTYYRVGRLRVTVNGDSFTIENLDYPLRSPHPQFAAHACFGTAMPTIKRFFQERDERTLVNYLLRALREVNNTVHSHDAWEDNLFTTNQKLNDRSGDERIGNPQSDEVRERTGLWWQEETLKCYRLVIAGLGNLGSWFAIHAAKIGFREIILIDPDIVEDGNLSSQFYPPVMVGKAKIWAMGKLLEPYPCRSSLRMWRGSLGAEDNPLELIDSFRTVVVTGFDTFEWRRRTWQYLQGLSQWFALIDGRVDGMVGEVHTVKWGFEPSLINYERFGLGGIDLPGETGCGRNAYSPATMMVVALMLKQLHSVLHGQAFVPQLRFDLSNLEEGLHPFLIWNRGEVNP